MDQAFRLVSLLLVVFSGVWIAYSQNPSAVNASTARVATIDSRAFSESKTGIVELSQAFDAIERTLESEISELKTILDKLNAAAEDMSKCQKPPVCHGPRVEQFMRYLQELQEKAVLKQHDLETKYKREQTSKIRPLEKLIKLRLEEFAKNRGFDVLIDIAVLDDGRTSYLFVGKKVTDLTRDFIDFYNANSKLESR